MIELKKVAHYVSDKIETSALDIKDYVSTDNMLPYRGGVNGCECLPQDAKVTKYSSGDILVSNIRPYFKKIWFADRSGGCSNDVIVFRTNDEKADAKFLYYVLSQESFFDFMMSGANGTKMPRGNKKLILDFKIPNYDIKNQKCIASILSAYDELIENNKKQIKLLEEAAQRLYKEWFVDLRFPGYEDVEIVDGLPSGWNYSDFSEEVKYITGKLDSNAAVENGRYSFYTCAKEKYKTNTFCFEGECVLLGGNNATGDFSLFYANEKLDVYQRTYIVTPKNSLLSCPYIYLVLKNYLTQLKNASNGSTTKFLTKGILDKIKVLIPYSNVASQFGEITKNMFNEIIELKAQNEKLQEARDRLLPKLMSGEVEV